jgi:Flp pilus assembly protein TadD
MKGNPRHSLARDVAAQALMQVGRFADAEKRLRERLALGPERADTRMNLAVCRERVGDVDGAIAEWRKALEIDPLNSQVIQRLAAMLDRAGKPEEAREMRARLKSRLTKRAGGPRR